MSIGTLFSRTYRGSSDFSYAAEPVWGGSHLVSPFPTKGNRVYTFIPLDDHIGYTISQRRRGTSITLPHPGSQLDVRLFGRVVRLCQGLRDNELRHVDLVLQEVGNNMFRVTGSVGTSEVAQRWEG